MFACGSYIEAKDMSTSPVGKKLVVQLSPKDEKMSVPFPVRHCAYGCPCTIKESGRKVTRGWNEKGERGYMVTCKVTDHQACEIGEVTK
jgi:hypothetical protein